MPTDVIQRERPARSVARIDPARLFGTPAGGGARTAEYVPLLVASGGVAPEFVLCVYVAPADQEFLRSLGRLAEWRGGLTSDSQ